MSDYPRAYYQEENQGVWQCIWETALTPKKIAQCRSLDLRDCENGLIELIARNHPTAPHFYPKVSERKSLGGHGGEGDRHGALCKWIPDALNSTNGVEVGYFEGTKFKRLYLLSDYRWKQPGCLDVAERRRYIPDVLGRSPEIDLLDKCPFVAIEVVDTHFSDFETFEVLIMASEKMPLFVPYIFVNGAYAHNGVQLNDQKLPAQVRARYYITDGSFWVDGVRYEEGQSYQPTGKLADYYFTIKDALTRLKLIRV